MYSMKKIPEPFNGKPCKKATPPIPTMKSEEIPMRTEEKTLPARKKTEPALSPLLALFFLDFFPTQKKDG